MRLESIRLGNNGVCAQEVYEVYLGASSYTRCVWEVGQLVSLAPVPATGHLRFDFCARALRRSSARDSFRPQVRLGNVDMCVGNFWETEERRSLAGFASAMDSDVLRLGTVRLAIFRISNDFFIVAFHLTSTSSVVDVC